MTTEQFREMLAEEKEKVINFHLYENKVPNQGNRSYLFRKKGSPNFGASNRRSMQRGKGGRWGFTGAYK